jgi:hypothetical protein
MDYTRIEYTDKGIFIGKSIPISILCKISEYYIDYFEPNNQILCDLCDFQNSIYYCDQIIINDETLVQNERNN